MINELEKIIYNLFIIKKDELFPEISGVFSCIEKNTIFPYIQINVVNLLNTSNFLENISKFDVELRIFDKNTNNLRCLSISNKVIKLLSNIDGLNINNIIDVKFLNQKISYKVDSSLWEASLNFIFILKFDSN